MTHTAGAGRSPRLRRGRFVAIATGAALVIVAAHATVVQAADPVQYLDDGTIVHRPMYVEPPVQEWKQRSYDLFLKLKDGNATAAQTREFLTLTASNRPGGARNKLSAQTGADALAFTYPTSLTLLQTQTPQSKSFYCGPASGNAVIKSWHGQFAHTTASAVDGAALSQSRMAASTYMNTEGPQRTDWLDNDFPNGVNKWLGTLFYVQHVGTSAADISSHVQYDIYNYYMLGSDMHENAGGAHYNHHPVAKAINHWTTIYGYSSSGATIKFQDPAANTASGVLGSDWGSVNPYFSLSSSDTFFYMDQNGLSRGIVW